MGLHAMLQRAFSSGAKKEDGIPCPQSVTGLQCLVLCLRHHGAPADADRLSHDFALDGSELPLSKLASMAETFGFKAKVLDMDWEKALSLLDALPLVFRLKDGRSCILSGARKNEDGETELAVLDTDPAPDDPAPEYSGFRFWNQQIFEERSAGAALLLKKRYRLDEEERPFGLTWFLPEFLKLKGAFGQIAAAVFMMTALSLAIPLYFQIVIDKVLPNSTFTTLNVLGVGVCAAILFNAGAEWLRNWLLLFATRRIDANTGVKTFRKLMRLPVSFFDSMPSGLLIKHMQQTESIRGFLSGNLFFTCLDLLSLLVFIPFLLCYSATLTGIVILFALLMATVVWALLKPFQRRLDTLYKAEGKRQSRLVESLHGIHTVKSLALEPVEEKAWNDATAFSVNAHFDVGKISIAAGALSQMLEALMQVAIIWAGAHLVFNHVISIGALIAFQMLSGRASAPLVRLVGLVHEWQRTALSVKMLGTVMNAQSEPAGGGVRLAMQGAVSFERVFFRYADGLPDVLHDVSFDVKPGETVGICGRSGSGKSTLARLIQAMHTPQSGLVKIDGVDVRELDKAHLRQSVGIVLQENYFFQGTVRDNIMLTKPDATPEEVVQAARMSGAHSFISELPKGYDTELEENASNLSGGQKQRLAIARALLSNPRILILDEATSALDPESEQIVQENLSTIARGRTVIVIAHRLSMIRHADRILVLDHGRVQAFAPHDVLANREGLYRDFWLQQTGGFGR